MLALNPNKYAVSISTEMQGAIYDKCLRSAQAIVEKNSLDIAKGAFFYVSSGTRQDNGYGDHSNALDISCGNQLGSNLHYKFLYALALQIHRDHPELIVALSMHVRHIHVQMPHEGGGRLVLEVSPSAGVYHFIDFLDSDARIKYDVADSDFQDMTKSFSGVWVFLGLFLLVAGILIAIKGVKK